MLKLQNPIAHPLQAMSGMSGGNTQLGVSWLNGHFKAVAARRGQVVATWESPAPVEDLSVLTTLLQKAVEVTGYDGHSVSIVMAHPRLSQQFFEVPQVRGTTLNRLLKRQVEQQKTFEGAAVWALQPTFKVPQSNGMLLHIMPRAVVDQVSKACRTAGLRLQAILPATLTLQNQVQLLGIGKEDTALIASDVGGLGSLVLVRGDGQILLARSLANGWSQDRSRFGLDLSRTVLFVGQQFGVTPVGAWLLGAGGAAAADAIRSQIKLPIEAMPGDPDPFVWAQTAAQGTGHSRLNLFSREMQEAPQRRILVRVMAIVTALLVINSIATAVYFTSMIQNEQVEVERLRSLSAQLQGTHKDLQRLHMDVLAKQQLLIDLGERRLPPAPTWFLGYLSEALPMELLVTNFHMRNVGSTWHVTLAGGLQPSTNLQQDIILNAAVSQFSNRLASGPFRFQFTNNPALARTPRRGDRPEGQNVPFADFLRMNAAAATPSRASRFDLRGSIQHEP